MNAEQLKVMLDMQFQMNAKVDPKWLNSRYPWWRAIWIEAAEGVEHHGYKWWKKQTPNLPQIQMEIVDIWHFGLSLVIQTRADFDAGVEDIHASFTDDPELYDSSLADIAKAMVSFWRGVSIPMLDQEWVKDKVIVLAFERIAIDALTLGTISISAFVYLLKFAEMTSDDLFEAYMAKNVLNFFRQDNGYKEGTYTKIWNGREDNEYLTDIMTELRASGVSPAHWKDIIYDRLDTLYKTLR